jgi:hypothetical protein
MFKSGNAINMVMGIVEIGVTGMTKALVPEGAFRSDTKLVEMVFLRSSVEGMKEGSLIRGRQRWW